MAPIPVPRAGRDTRRMPLHQTPTPGVTSIIPRRLPAGAAGLSDARVRAGQLPELDVGALLELLERGPLSAAELRILLAVLERERAVSELAEAFGRRPVEIRRSGARLYARGLLHWRHTGPGKEAVFGITPSGLATLRPLLTAARARAA